mmetsp:Transcript_28822/g.82551  ORF Transcript_28822/g.82551 Transcript_28822/m.82551 type:complete len:274 (-) Transcript_28822:517-1338(-)
MDLVLSEGIHLDRTVRSRGQSILHLGHGLTGQCGLVDDGAAVQQQAVAGHGEVGLLGRLRLLALLLRLWLFRHEGDDVPWQQLLNRPLLPRGLTVHVHGEALGAHPAQRCHRLQALESGRCLESEDGQKCEAGVFPVGVQHPQGCAEELEDRQGRHELFLVQLPERRPGELEDVRAVLVLRDLDLPVAREPARLLVVLPPQVRGALDQPHAVRAAVAVDEVGVLLVRLDHLVALVLEGEGELERDLRLLQPADVRLSLVGVWREPHEVARPHT